MEMLLTVGIEILHFILRLLRSLHFVFTTVDRGEIQHEHWNIALTTPRAPRPDLKDKRDNTGIICSCKESFFVVRRIAWHSLPLMIRQSSYSKKYIVNCSRRAFCPQNIYLGNDKEDAQTCSTHPRLFELTIVLLLIISRSSWSRLHRAFNVDSLQIGWAEMSVHSICHKITCQLLIHFLGLSFGKR